MVSGGREYTTRNRERKFLQNKELLRRFQSEKYTKYYECTTDLNWGGGFKLDAVDLDPEAIKGRNRFGLILTDLKGELTIKK